MIVKVNIENREDGGVHVWSDELPGLILSGRNRIAILADIEPAVRALLEHKGISTENLRIDAAVSSPQSETGK